MSTNALGPFRPEALEANRRGELTDVQLRSFGSLSRRRRKSARGTAGLLAAGGLLIAFFASPTFSPVLRALIPLVCLAVAAFLILRAVSGADALARDLKEGRVQFVEGAIGKSSQSVDEGNDIYSLDVGDSRFNVMPMTYDAAPDAGYVRLYFLPTSRIVVNLERLPDPPVEIGTAARDLVQSLGAAARFHDRRMLNEARASMAGLGNAMKAAFAQPPAPPADTRDPRPLASAILGTWSNGFVTAKFSADGTVTTSGLGRERAGRWSIDANGHLCSDVTGQQQAAEAWVAGGQLIISVQDKGLTLTRKA